jgi:hypothetical protein
MRRGSQPRSRRRVRALPRAILILAALCLLPLLIGCSDEQPVLSRVYGRVIYELDPSNGACAETLGVFLVASDPDGMEDLGAFYVINDGSELFWKVDSDTWITASAEGESWIGATSLTMPDEASLPSGEYRVVLQSVSGDTVEDTLAIPERTASALTAQYPTATVADGSITVANAPADCEVWTYGRDGKYVSAFPLTGKTKHLSVQNVSGSSPALANGFTFRVYTWNEKGGYATLCGPYASSNTVK